MPCHDQYRTGRENDSEATSAGLRSSRHAQRCRVESMMDQRSAPALRPLCARHRTTRRIAPIKMNPGEMPTWWVPQLARELQSLFVAKGRKSFCIVRNRARCPDHIERVTVKGLLTGAPPDFIAVNPVSGRNGRLRRELPVPQRPQPHWQLSYPPIRLQHPHHCTESLLCQGMLVALLVFAQPKGPFRGQRDAAAGDIK